MFTGQQREFAIQRFASYRWNPRAMVHDLFRDLEGRPLEITDYQADIMLAVAMGKDVTVRSGHGVGKTTTDALIVFHTLLTRPYSLIPTTAPTFRQVKDVLWAEIASLYSRFACRAYLQLDKTKLTMLGTEKWMAIGVASNRPSNIEGFHAPHVLFIVDEAKGVQKGIFDSIDGALTTGGQRLYTSTPGSRIGQFYESHFGRIAKYFHRIHIDASTVTAKWVNKKWQAQKAEEWGIDSPIFQAKVRGEFPDEGTDILIRLDYILAAEESYEEERCSKCGKLEICECDAPSLPAIAHASHRTIGCDVARFGVDDTAAAYGSSSRLEAVRAWSKEDTTKTTGRLIAWRRELAEQGFTVDGIGVDDTGVGGGVTDQLRAQKVPTQPVIFGAKSELTTPDRLEHFRNNKAWFAWKYRKALEENWQARQRGEVGTYAICRDDKLKGQLSNIRVNYSAKGQLYVIDPDDPEIDVAELPKGVRVSPDRAHAVFIQYHAATTAAGVAAGIMKPPTPTKPADPRRVSRFIFGRSLRMG